MIPTNQFNRRFKDAELYELPVLCIQDIGSQYLQNSPAFISAFIDPIYQGSSSSEFKQFWDELKKRIQVCRETGKDDIEEIKKCIADQLDSFHVPAGSDMEYVRSVCMFIILVELDNFVRAREDEMAEKETTPYHKNGNGPLNDDFDTDQYLVYRKVRNSFISRANSDTKNGFRSILTTREIGDRFNSLQIVNKEQLPTRTIPKIILARPGQKTMDAAKDLKEVRIAVIPYISFDTFCFHEVGKKDPVEPKKLPNGQFYIDYSNEKSHYAEQVVFLLDKAIEGKANIVVFPEFVMSPSMLEAVKKKLSALESTEETSLWVVFAGSTYGYDQGAKTGNNILHILSSRGEERGIYYKHNQFHKDESTKEAENRGYFGIKSMELLSDPGKEICLIDVPRLGRILPGICKDVIESNYTRKLSKIFHPSMQIIPAWSTSISSFDFELLAAANEDHVTSVVCNCCNAVEEGKENIGKAYLPRMEDGDMSTKAETYRRTDDCYRKCIKGKHEGKKKGCIHFIDINIEEILPSWIIRPGVTFDE